MCRILVKWKNEGEAGQEGFVVWIVMKGTLC